MKILVVSIMTLSILFPRISHAKIEVQPEVSIVHGSERGTSVLVLTWPKGATDLLICKDKELESNKKNLFKWVEERTDDYNRKH